MDRCEWHGFAAGGKFERGRNVLAHGVITVGHPGPVVGRTILACRRDERFGELNRERFEPHVCPFEDYRRNVWGDGREFGHACRVRNDVALRRGPRSNQHMEPVPGGTQKIGLTMTACSREGPTEMRSTGHSISVSTRLMNARAGAGRSSKVRTSVVGVCQPGSSS